MPCRLFSCFSNSISCINTLAHTSSAPDLSGGVYHSSDGWITTSTKIKMTEIKPPASCLHPRLRMSAEDYHQYSKLMDSLEVRKEKKVHFAEDNHPAIRENPAAT